MGRKDKKIPTDESDIFALGARMRSARQQKGVSLTEMAERLAYTKSHLSAVENGVGRPSRELVESYERELGLTPGELTRLQNSTRTNLGHRHTPIPETMLGRKRLGLEKELLKEQQLESSLQRMREPAEQDIQTDFAAEDTKHQHEYREDWEDVPSIENFYGRVRDLAELEQWIVQDHCPVVAILGMGGMGKSTLAAKIATQMRDDFDYSFWRSLRNSPHLESILRECIHFFSDRKQIEIPRSEEQQIGMLVEYLQEHRCLIVLDNFESVLAEGKRVGQYRPGFDKYGQLIDIINSTRHQSCILITGREKPREVARAEGARVRSLQLIGIGSREGREMLKDKDLFGSSEAWERLVTLYSGNPLALKLAAAPIHEVFGGDIAEFLKEGGVIIGDIHDLFDQQFQRLSEQEREILYWLAVEREPVLINDLREDLARPVSRVVILEALDSLRRRSMLEMIDGIRFYLQPVIMEYITDSFVERIFDEIANGTPALFASHALIKATAKDYVRNSQVRLILEPLAGRLITTFGKDRCKEKLDGILSTLRKTRSHTPEYAAGNLLNLLVQLQIELKGYDFSTLVVWQAYLQGVHLRDVDFTSADLSQSVFTDTFGSILSVALDMQGTVLAAGTTNDEIRLWQMPDGTPLLPFQGHTDWIRSEAFSPDGKLLASASDDQTVRLWDMVTGQTRKVFYGHSSRIYSVVFNPDGRLVASAGEDQTIRLWDVGNGDNLEVLAGHAGRIYSIKFSPDGKLMLSGSEDKTLRIWDVNTGVCLKVLTGHSHRVVSVAISPSGDIFASGSEDQTICLWEATTGRCLRELKGHTDSVETLAFNSDGTLLASGSHDKTVRLWDLKTGQCTRILYGHDNWVSSVVFMPDGETLISGSTDQTIRIWDVHAGYCLKTLQGVGMARYSVAFSPDGKSVVGGSEDKIVGIWEVDTGHSFRELHGHTNWVRSVAFSPDGASVASAGEDQTVRLWNVQTGQCLKVLRGHDIWVYSVTFSPNGNMVASGSEDQTIRLWDVQTGQCKNILLGHTRGVWSVIFSPDGNTLISSSEDQTIRLWDVQTGQCLKTFQGKNGWIPSIDISFDGKTLVSGSDEKVICLWDVQTGQCLKTFLGHESTVYSVHFSPDGSLLVSGGEDRTVRLWDTKSGLSLGIFQDHGSWVYSTTFSPDGRFIASSSGDGTIRLWDVQKRKCIRILRSDRLYEGTKITDVKGLTATQRAMLRGLGAVEN